MNIEDIDFDESNVIGNFTLYIDGVEETLSDSGWIRYYGPALNDKTSQMHPQLLNYIESYANLMCKFILDNNDNLWTMGYNRYGRLGVNSDNIAISEYTKVEFPNQIQFSNIRDIIRQKEFDKKDNNDGILKNIIFNISDDQKYVSGRFRGKDYKSPSQPAGLNTIGTYIEKKNLDIFLYKDHMVNNSKNNKTENVHIVPSTVQTIDGILLMDNKDIRTGYPKPFILK